MSGTLNCPCFRRGLSAPFSLQIRSGEERIPGEILARLLALQQREGDLRLLVGLSEN